MTRNAHCLGVSELVMANGWARVIELRSGYYPKHLQNKQSCAKGLKKGKEKAGEEKKGTVTSI